MATSRTSRAPSQPVAGNAADALKWVRWGIELLWLLTVILVPLAFLRIADTPLSLPSPIETAKIATFRTLVALMAILLLVEWALVGKWPFNQFTRDQESYQLKFDQWLPQLFPRFKEWLSADPTRLIIVAVLLFLTSLLLGTLFSASIGASLWGRVPGTDTGAAYTAGCYFLLFAIISTHLKTVPQLWRLCGAIIGVGVLVGGYAVLQHYGQGFLQVAEPETLRVSSTLGNPIFAGSVLLITTTLSAAAATYNLGLRSKANVFWLKTVLWAGVLAVQLAGSLFTFSRGAWGGTVVALGVFLLLAAVVLNRQTTARVLLVLVMSGVLGVIMGTLIALDQGEEGWYQSTLGDASTLGLIKDRFQSLQTDTVSTSLGQRLQVWEVSGEVIRDRPWFEFDDLPLTWVRPILGYGPDLFSPVFMLRSPAVAVRQLPLETTHSHNYFIHQWVELGVLGFLGAVAVFLVPMLVGGWLLLKYRRGFSLKHRVMLIGLIAVLVGRFLEQQVGVAKVSDTILFWVLLAIFVSLPSVMGSSTPLDLDAELPLRLVRRRGRANGRASPSVFTDLDSGAYARLAVAGLLIAGIMTLTWVKNFNNVSALGQVSTLNPTYDRGELNSSVGMIRRAAESAPDVHHYWGAAGAIYSAYRTVGGSPGLLECSPPEVGPDQYDACLAEKVYQSYLMEVDVNPWSWQPRLNLADAAADLASIRLDPDLTEEVIRRYQESSQMAPNSWRLQNQLAKTYISSGQPEAGLEVIEQSLAITGVTLNAAEAMLLKGLAYGALGQLQDALAAYDEAIRLDREYALAYNNRANVYNQLGQFQLAISDLDQVIGLNPENAVAYNNRGNAYSSLAQYTEAIESFDSAILVQPGYVQAFKNRGDAYALLGQHEEAVADFDRAIQIAPSYADAYVGRALAYAQTDHIDEARQDVEIAVALGIDRNFLEEAINDLLTEPGVVHLGQ